MFTPFPPPSFLPSLPPSPSLPLSPLPPSSPSLPSLPSLPLYSIERYSVIPLSPNSGLIGWVPHCDTIHSLIRDYREKKKIMLNIEHRLMLQVMSSLHHNCMDILTSIYMYIHVHRYKPYLLCPPPSLPSSLPSSLPPLSSLSPPPLPPLPPPLPLLLQMSSDYDHLTLMQKVEVFEQAIDSTSGDDLAKVLWLKSPSSEVSWGIGLVM